MKGKTGEETETEMETDMEGFATDLSPDPFMAISEGDYEEVQPRRSGRIAAQPQPESYTIPEGADGDAVWGVLMDQYREKIGQFVPAKNRKFIMMEYLDYLSRQDYYVGDMFNTQAIATINTGKIFFPAELFKLDAEDRNFFNAKLNWVLKSKHADAETYCKAIACALMVKDMMRVICTLVYQLPPSLWQTGKIPAGKTRADTAILNNQREANLKIFNDMLMTGRAWWPRDFVSIPTGIPYKIKDNLWTMAATKFERFTDGYSIVMGTLNDLKNQFSQTKKIIVQLIDPEGKQQDDEKAEQDSDEMAQDEIDLRAADDIVNAATDVESFDNFKQQLIGALQQAVQEGKSAEDDMLRANIEFLQSKTTPGGQPIVVNVGSSSSDGIGGGGGGGFGIIGGLLFTLWLLSNMD